MSSPQKPRRRTGEFGGSGGGGGRKYAPRRKVCTFCVDKVVDVDYKDLGRLRRFLSDRGKIEPRRKTGTCAPHQRSLNVALKRARHLALLPFTAEHIRITGMTLREPSGPRGPRFQRPVENVEGATPETAATPVDGAVAAPAAETAPEAAPESAPESAPAETTETAVEAPVAEAAEATA